MGKATIIEAQNSNTVYEEGKTKGILGKLKGIFADYKNGTRNANRLYTEELWDNRVFGSEDVMEALETKTLFGELDHPEGDRCETLAQNAAITITKLEKRPEEGVIYGEAEILDTPTGRIVKALADSGARLGISSRGMGEEIFSEGKNIIDPETYDFITFDVVVTPANTKARVTLTESKQLNKLIESFKKEINESETINQLSQMKKVLETINVENKETLVDLVETKLNLLNKDDNTQISLSEANRMTALNILKEKLSESKAQIEELTEAANTLSNENQKLVEENKFYSESRETLKTKLKEAKTLEDDLKDKIKQNEEELTEANNKIEECNTTITSLTAKLEEANNKILDDETNKLEEAKNNDDIILNLKAINNKKIENLEIKHQEEIAKLNEALETSNSKYNNLLESNKQLAKNLESNASLLKENKELQHKLDEMIQKEQISKKSLQESKILERNKISTLENKIKELENNLKQKENLEERFSKLAFTPMGTVKAMQENFNQNEDLTDEDRALFGVLTHKN